MNLDCLCRLTNGNIYILNKGRVVTFHKEKATEKFVLVHGIVQDKYECPLDQILPEIEEAFDYGYFALCDVFGAGDEEWYCTYDENGVVFEDSIFSNHNTWEVQDRDTIVKKVPFSEVTEYIVYKHMYIEKGVILNPKRVERIVLSKDEWLRTWEKYDRSIL